MRVGPARARALTLRLLLTVRGAYGRNGNYDFQR